MVLILNTMHEIAISEGFGKFPPKKEVKTEDSNFFGNEKKIVSDEPKFSDVMPYPQFFVGFAIGALAIAYASNWYFESKY